MNKLTQAWTDLAARITTAGVPATTDPGRLLSLIAGAPSGVAVLLLPPDPEGWALSTYHLSVPVVLVTAGPDNHQAVERLHDEITTVLRVAGSHGEIVRDPYDAADGVVLPAQRWRTELRVKNP